IVCETERTAVSLLRRPETALIEGHLPQRDPIGAREAPMPVLLRSATEADAKHVESLLTEATRRRRRMSAIASVVRCTATLAVFSLHNRQARSSAWLAPNSSPISQTARQFAESLVSSSRHIIVVGVSVKSFLPARPNSHANIIAQGLRSPVQNIVLTRTGSTSGSGSPEPRSDSSTPSEHAC